MYFFVLCPYFSHSYSKDLVLFHTSRVMQQCDRHCCQAPHWLPAPHCDPLRWFRWIPLQPSGTTNWNNKRFLVHVSISIAEISAEIYADKSDQTPQKSRDTVRVRSCHRYGLQELRETKDMRSRWKVKNGEKRYLRTCGPQTCSSSM